MARTLPASRVNQELEYGNLVFAPARIGDESDLTRLLRDNPLGGDLQISMEREPDVFASDFGLSTNRTFIVARDKASGEAIGMCERTVYRAFVNGREEELPYLSALRVAPSHRHRIRVLRGGFQALRQFAELPGELPYAITSITADNTDARRLLTRGLPGLPVYNPAGDFTTFALRPRRGSRSSNVTAASERDLPEICAFLRRANARLQFGPAWTVHDLTALGRFGLKPEHFLVARSNGHLIGCVAVWDQRMVRQTVVRRYPPMLGRMRRVLNTLSPIVGLPRLPEIGVPLRQATLSHLAVKDDDPDCFLSLVGAALDQARKRGLDVAAIGFATDRALREILKRKYRTIEYRTALYLAYWPEAADDVALVRPMPPHPELGLL